MPHPLEQPNTTAEMEQPKGNRKTVSQQVQSTVESEIEAALRPSGFHEFTGQSKVVDNLMVFIKAA